jgi:osomolarity two-component system sensor histidine kinase SLN1
MRIGIREQLGAVVLITALVPLAVLAIATWINNHNFVVNITSQSLTLTASLKAAQVASDLLLIQATCATIVTRILLQDAIRAFYRGNGTANNWTVASDDISSALASGGLSALLQVTVFSRNQTGDPYGILNATAVAANIGLPYQYPNGTQVMLGDPGLGYPRALYPNITYNSTSEPNPGDPSINATQASAFLDFPLNSTSLLMLGPLQINNSYALLSLTLPIMDNSNPENVLGFMTVVAAASSLIDVVQSREGLASTGIVLIVGPNRRENQFRYVNRPANANYLPLPSALDPATVKYVFPPVPFPGQSDRHSVYNANLSKYGSSNFTEAQYPAVAAGFGSQNPAINNASSILSTNNENNASVAVGYARPQSVLVDWLLIVEQSHAEAWAPITKLRNIVLACVFGAIGLVLIFVVPMAHYSVRPIRRLRDATKKSIAPPGYTPNGSVRSDDLDDQGYASGEDVADEENALSARSKKGFLIRLRNLTSTGRRKSKIERDDENRRRVFKIPGKVPDREHWIKDELSDLTGMRNSVQLCRC